MNDEKTISLAVIKRLPRYYRYLGFLLENDIARISSKELSERMNLTASQVRQDFNNFGCFGQQGYGYNVASLHSEIQSILGLDKTYNMIIVGIGNIGQALINHSKFKAYGFNFIGFFDNNPQIIGKKIEETEVLNITELTDFISKNKVDIAVLSLPSGSAEKTARTIIDAGITGIWNFSHVDLGEIKGVTVENVHLTDSLMTLSYNLR